MDRPVIIIFSQEEENLKRVILEVQEHFTSDENHYKFNDKSSLLKALANGVSESGKCKLFILDLNDSSAETIGFLNQINHICEDSIKLIISENKNLIEILEKVENNTSLMFLKNSWTKTDLKLSLNLASKAEDYLRLTMERNREKQVHSINIEEKINERLKELIESNTAKDKFLSIIAHDLKNPFSALFGLTEILTNNWDELEDSERLELVTDIKNTTEVTFNLLVDLLEWARNQKEKWDVCINEIEIRRLVDSTIKLAEKNATPKKISVKNQIGENLKVKADENMMATIFRNLITNAVKFTPPGGNIKISATEEENFCTFCVADNGIGIDKPHILELFKKGNKKKLNGNASSFKGLGLIICKDFVEKNGGQIWLETQKGEGSKFFFTVPC